MTGKGGRGEGLLGTGATEERERDRETQTDRERGERERESKRVREIEKREKLEEGKALLKRKKVLSGPQRQTSAKA